jgi:tripartite-type tricarboxylate transporter receptor subunit TctC
MAAIALAVAGSAHAQSFPTKPMRLVASTLPGSQPDTIARTIAQKMSDAWGVPVVVDNRAGGGGTLAALPVAKAAPDGHTLLYVLPNFTINAVMQPNLPFDPVKDFAGVSHLGLSTNVLVVAPSLGVKTVKDFVALAKTQPGKLIHASSAAGTASHLTGLRFNLLAGIKAVNVAYKGGPEATIELLGGRAHYHVGTMGVLLPFVKDGKLVALGVTTPQRAPSLPDVPALGEIYAEFKRPETSHGLLAPAGTPRAVLIKISKEVARILTLPDVRERLDNISYVATPSSPEEYDQIRRGQVAALAKLVTDAGLKPK